MHAYFWAPQQCENTWGAKKFKSLLFFNRSTPAYPAPLHTQASAPCPLGDARSLLVCATQAAWSLSGYSEFCILLTTLRPPGCLTPPGPSADLLALGALLDTRRPLATCSPPSCSATSFLLGFLQASLLPAKHSASSRQPIQCPPGYSASSRLPCARLVVRRHLDCSTSSLLVDVLVAQFHLGCQVLVSPWQLNALLSTRCTTGRLERPGCWAHP